MLYDMGRTNGSQYNDVISGSNKCCAQSSGNGSPTCCITGFVSAPGWDPVVRKDRCKAYLMMIYHALRLTLTIFFLNLSNYSKDWFW